MYIVSGSSLTGNWSWIQQH